MRAKKYSRVPDGEIRLALSLNAPERCVYHEYREVIAVKNTRGRAANEYAGQQFGSMTLPASTASGQQMCPPRGAIGFTHGRLAKVKRNIPPIKLVISHHGLLCGVRILLLLDGRHLQSKNETSDKCAPAQIINSLFVNSSSA